MNNLPYFWKVEDDELRGDPNDSVVKIARLKKMSFSLPGNDGKLHPIEIEGEGILRFHPAEPKKINLFCLYAMHSSLRNNGIDKKNLRFGEFALVIKRPQDFIYRLASHLKEQKIPRKGDLVEYFENDYSGVVGPFKKSTAFEYQSEWRLVCENGPGKERILEIGSIEGASTIVRSEEVNSFIRKKS